MNIFKSKLLWLAPIAVILLLVIFSLAFYPAFNPKPKQLPIAVVNNDKGVDIQGNKVNIGKKIEDKLMDSDSDTVKWVKVDKESDIKKGLKDEKYYKVVMDSKKAEMKEKVESGEIPAAAVQQMQKKMGNQKVDVKQATFKTIVNKGASMQAATITGNVLDGMGDNLNKQITSQSLSTLEKQDVKVSASDIKGITNPVKVDNQEIHKVKDHQGGGNAPFLMFMPVWMGSLVASVLLFFAFRTSNNFKIQHRIIASFGQMLLAVITAFAGSFAYVYFMHGVLGFDFNNTNRVALFLAISILGFIGLILGIMVWLGMKAIPIFVILMFFSMQLVTLPKQMLPKGYQGWVYDFDPFTHYTNTLREIIYMGSHIEMNATIWMMIGFIIFGAISSLTAAIVRKHSNKRTEIPS